VACRQAISKPATSTLALQHLADAPFAFRPNRTLPPYG